MVKKFIGCEFKGGNMRHAQTPNSIYYSNQISAIRTMSLFSLSILPASIFSGLIPDLWRGRAPYRRR